MRSPVLLLCLLASLPAAAAPVTDGAPRLALWVEGLGSQPLARLGNSAGGAAGVGVRLTDQLWIVGDYSRRTAPRGGLGSVALGLQATLDATPISPWLELSVLGVGPRETAGYTLATRTGFGADWHFAPGFALGLAVRTVVAADPIEGGSPTGVEAAFRFIVFPGGF